MSKSPSSKLPHARNERLNKARTGKRTIDQMKAALSQDMHAPSSDHLQVFFTRVFAYFKVHADNFQTAAQAYATRRDAKAEYYRLFQWEHGVRRPASKPDPLNTVLTVMMCGLAEGMGAGALMIGQGMMSPMSGIGFGLLFSSINILTGIVGSFYGLRWAFYHIHSPEPQPHDVWKRLGGWAVFTVSLILVLLLIFTAARTRALGSHHDIFNFLEITFFQTFNDSFAVALMSLVIVSSFIAYAKGYSGLSDPIPNYTKARREAEDEINQEIDALRDEYEADILDAYDEIVDDAYDALDQADDYKDAFADDLNALQEAIAKHNDQLCADKDALRALADSETHKYVQIKRSSDAAPVNLGLEAFDALYVVPISLSNLPDLVNLDKDTAKIRAELSALSESKADALASLADAYSEFRTAAPDLDAITPPKGV